MTTPPSIATIQVTTGRLWSAPRLRDAPDAIIRTAPDVLDIGLFPGDTLQKFEHELATQLKGVGTLARFRFHNDTASVALVPLAIALAITVVLGVLATYENLVSDMLVDLGFSTAWKGLLLLATATFLVVGITFFPSLLSSADDNRARDFVTRWYNRDDRVRRRIHYALRTLTVRRCGAVALWNPFAAAEASWVWRSLVPAVMALKLPVTIHIKSDELDALFAALRTIDPTRRTVQENPAAEDASADTTVPAGAIWRMLSPTEQVLLDTLCTLSTHQVPDAWGNADRARRLRGLISLDLAAFVVTHCMGGYDTSRAAVDVRLLNVLFRRCVADYRLAVRYSDHGDRYWRLSDSVPQIVADAGQSQRRHQIANCIETDAFDLMRHVGDPIGLLLAYATLEKSGATSKLRRQMLSTMIERALAAETYFLMDYFVGILEHEAPPGASTGREDFLRLLPLATLQQLVPLLERAGYFNDAIAVADLLRPTDPGGTLLMKARLFERMGRYREGLELLDELDRSTNVIAQMNTSGDRVFSLRLALATCWTIVSGRLEAERARGKGQLIRAGEIVQRICHSGGSCDPELLWHHYNNLAQYDEWDENLDACITNHVNCQSLPGIEIKWISGTHVNLGIAYRERFNRKRNIDDLTSAVTHARRGVDIKRELGDLDELPIALHNLAYTLLIQFVEQHDPATVEYARASIDEGLRLLDATGSSKKRGQLLAESWVAFTLGGDHAHAAALEPELAAWKQTAVGSQDLHAVERIVALAASRGSA